MKKTLLTILAFALAACSGHVPSKFVHEASEPDITPDYRDIEYPSNMAPANFRIENEGTRFVTLFTAGNRKAVLKGRVTDMPLRKWRRLQAGGGTITVQVFARSGKEWKGYRPFTIHMAEPIDRYMAYRMIPPLDEYYEEIFINQRDLTTFKEKTIYSNAMVHNGSIGQCINCHHFRNYTTDNMQFHARQYKGGTVMLVDGELRMVNLKTDSTLSAGVYPAWHPTHDYIAYSTNITKQAMHLSDPNRVEVRDLASDLILYDIKANAVSVIEDDSCQFECFPAWSPDGRTLYYVSAALEEDYDKETPRIMKTDYRAFHYDLYAKPFNPDTREWGPSRKIFDASAINRSVTLPRISPDGRYLMFSMGEYGIFHIWHRDADLYLMDLTTGQVRAMSEVNSDNVESYHSWSSNGRWIVFSSRRDDGAFTRLYLSHFDGNGRFSKPFAFPLRKPGYVEDLMKSYNIPEFITEPVKVSPRRFARFISRNPAESVGYAPKKTSPTPSYQ